MVIGYFSSLTYEYSSLDSEQLTFYKFLNFLWDEEKVMKYVCIKGHALVQWISVHWNNGSVFRHRSFMKNTPHASGSYTQAGRQSDEIE